MAVAAISQLLTVNLLASTGNIWKMILVSVEFDWKNQWNLTTISFLPVACYLLCD